MRAAGRTNPVPRRLREHLEGTRPLAANRVDRHLRAVATRLDLVALDALVAATLRELGESVPRPASGEAHFHALRLVALAEENRRPLRRLLRHPSAQHHSDEYVFTHPEACAWIARHPELLANLETWREGIVVTAEIAGFGPVKLAIASDPLEVLRMGTYVGSCLGLGGGLAYSAAAAALDANKRVVYARDAEGRVIARQLLAWSEDDRVVCFHRYVSRCPVSAVFGFSEAGAGGSAAKSWGSSVSPRASASAAARRYLAGSMPTSFAVSSSV